MTKNFVECPQHLQLAYTAGKSYIAFLLYQILVILVPTIFLKKINISAKTLVHYLIANWRNFQNQRLCTYYPSIQYSITHYILDQKIQILCIIKFPLQKKNCNLQGLKIWPTDKIYRKVMSCQRRQVLNFVIQVCMYVIQNTVCQKGKKQCNFLKSINDVIHLGERGVSAKR